MKDTNPDVERLQRKVERLAAELKVCRNELCLHCGQYKMRHKGACDGCRWLEVEYD